MAYWVYDVVVNSVELLEENLVEIQDELLSFTATAKVSFSAEVSYPDPEMTAYDSEEGEFIVLGTIEETLEKTTEVSVEVEIAFIRDEPHNPEVALVSLETGSIIEIKVDKYLYR